MRRMLLCVLALAGCDTLFGLKDVHPAADSGDDKKNTVVGHYTQHWYDFDPHGAIVPIVRELPPGDITNATVMLADGTTTDVMFDDTQFTFTTPVANEPYTLNLTIPLGVRTWVLSSDAPELLERYIAPPNHVAAPAGTIVQLDVPNRQFISNESVVTLGSYSIKNGSLGNPIDIDLSAVDSTTDVQIGELTNASMYYVSSTSSSTTPSYDRITNYSKVAGVTTPGMTTVTAGALTAPLNTSCVVVDIDADTELARNEQAVGTSLGFKQWDIVASPSFDTAVIAPTLPLASANYPSGRLTQNVSYTNIYGLANVSVYLLTYASANSSTSTTEIAVPAPSDCMTDTPVPVGKTLLPINVSVGGIAIATDKQIVGLPNDDTVTIAWQGQSGEADGYIVFIDQVVAGGVQNVEQITTTTQTASIPKSIFASGTYQIRVAAVLGFPNAAIGDFVTVATDVVGVGVLQTPTFVIQ
jgi:hypothetical protein